MALINSVLSWIIKKRVHQIELFTKYPNEVQQELLNHLLREARFTEWGKKYEYKTLNSAREFAERVPLQTYESIKPCIDKVMQGEQNVLWPSEIKWFAKSSGTTNDRSKFIPVSEESLEDCHFKAGKDMLSIFCNNKPQTKVFTGKSLVLGGSHQVNQLNKDSFYGDLSAVLIKNLPFWVEMQRTPEMSIALMDNWEEKIDKMALATIQEDVTNISGVPTWTAVLANRILEVTGKQNLLEVWPNLELYIHGAVSFTPYRQQFQQLMPSKDMYYLETYNASEGFFAIQDQMHSDELLLMLDYGIYYEFIEAEYAEDESPKTIGLSQVELGKNYAIVISTNAGLWRYKVGDTIKFTSKSPYRIKITGRTKHFINAFGEELIIDNAENALKRTCAKHECSINDYTAAPIYFGEKGEKGGHEWIIEFAKAPTNTERFADDLDAELRKLNSDYDAKRHADMALVRLKLHVVALGTFYQWMKQRGKLGGQHKVPRLANERTYVEDLLDSLTSGRSKSLS